MYDIFEKMSCLRWDSNNHHMYDIFVFNVVLFKGALAWFSIHILEER